MNGQSERTAAVMGRRRIQRSPRRSVHPIRPVGSCRTEPAVCGHAPACPSATALDRSAAHVVAAHPEQGWSLLCNGVVWFDDGGALLPDGRAVPPPPPQPMSKTRR